LKKILDIEIIAAMDDSNICVFLNKCLKRDYLKCFYLGWNVDERAQ